MALARHLVVHGGFPFAMPAAHGATPPQRAVRRHARALIRRRWPPALRPIGVLLMTLGWPVGAALLARATRDWAELPDDGRPAPRLRAWLAALRHNVAPAEYRAHGMGRPGAPPADAWLTTPELSRLTAGLAGPRALALCRDKAAFAAFAAEAGLPVAPVLAVYAGGAAVQPFDGAAPARDLLVKPRDGARGRGIAVWRWCDGAHHGPRGRSLTAALAEDSARGPAVVVQPRLCPPDGAGALPVVRAVTACVAREEPTLAFATVQQPQRGAITSQGGAYRAVETATGRVLPLPDWISFDPGARPFTLPEGEALPDWQGVREAVLRGHARMPGPPPLIGWDVAITRTGPVILEANLAQSLFVEQMLSGRPAWDEVGPALASRLP